jgi:predicted house-cleaning noncanonical NTP pyrophosphatase (MazG superfamily)
MEFVPTDHPIENEYPKLVRDIIKARTGVSPEHRIASDDAEFESFLLKKVVEEATELQHSSEHK